MLTDAILRQAAGEAGLAEPAIIVRRLGGLGQSDATLTKDRPLYPASMIKTPLAVAVLELIATGILSPHARIPVTESNMTANDLASPLVPGYQARLAELLDLMIAQSDNVATNTLIDLVGRQRATELLQARGYSGTAIRRKLSGSDPLIDDPEATGRNTHPPHDAARLFTDLALERLPLGPTLLNALERQRWNTKLSRGLRPGDRFAHKTGDTSEVSHDGGILTTANGARYVVVVYTGMPSSDETDTRFAEFMRRLRPHLV